MKEQPMKYTRFFVPFKESASGKAVLFDLDKTIGVFPEGKPPTLRIGMTDLLRDLRDAGVNVINTTVSDRPRAVGILESTGIDHLFDGVYGRDTVQPRDVFGKNYREVAKNHGYKDDQAIEENVLVIGDSKGDQPQDCTPVLIRLGRNRENMDALVFHEIIVALLEKGEGNFRKGFEALFAEAKFNGRDKTADIGNGITFHMDTETHGGDGSSIREQLLDTTDEPLIPVIFDIEAPDYVHTGESEVDPEMKKVHTPQEIFDTVVGLRRTAFESGIRPDIFIPYSWKGDRVPERITLKDEDTQAVLVDMPVGRMRDGYLAAQDGRPLAQYERITDHKEMPDGSMFNGILLYPIDSRLLRALTSPTYSLPRRIL